MNVEMSDLLKIRDALDGATMFHQKRDEMNAETHMAKEVRYSPLTTVLACAIERLDVIIKQG